MCHRRHVDFEEAYFMKKVTKATIAAVAAGALLLGGAGTVARWQAQQTIDAGTVETGHLNLTTGGAGVWQDISNPEAPEPFDPATQQLVPGDVVSFSQTATIDAEGKNIAGSLSVDQLDTALGALEGYVTVALQVDASAPGITEETDGTLTFAEPGTYSVPFLITVTFAEGTVGDTPPSTYDQVLDLEALTLTLDQVRA
ncbi:alternate-type signal peptide domain-containing protein [Glutamicibacter halophytocola]|uniref:Alternate-type signal peptide domain-containing protein n=2 Tax=Glutamicibacter halophytocola TaxID=1933880 RepID=A0ABX5YA04_9MICC|nr:alternate-type signal peptide domain-containing protein [Glutamicibacter halophytocola]